MRGLLQRWVSVSNQRGEHLCNRTTAAKQLVEQALWHEPVIHHSAKLVETFHGFAESDAVNAAAILTGAAAVAFRDIVPDRFDGTPQLLGIILR